MLQGTPSWSHTSILMHKLFLSWLHSFNYSSLTHLLKFKFQSGSISITHITRLFLPMRRGNVCGCSYPALEFWQPSFCSKDSSGSHSSNNLNLSEREGNPKSRWKGLSKGIATCSLYIKADLIFSPLCLDESLLWIPSWS